MKLLTRFKKKPIVYDNLKISPISYYLRNTQLHSQEYLQEDNINRPVFIKYQLNKLARIWDAYNKKKNSNG